MDAERLDAHPGTGDPPQRELGDVASVKALTHPVRLVLLDALRSGPLTATQAAELIGETPTTCSFHFRQLARFAFVEEVPGVAGRRRPWRLTGSGSWRTPRTTNPALRGAAAALDQALLAHYFRRLVRFVAQAPAYPESWYAATAAQQAVYHLTPAELAEMATAHRAVDDEFRRRWERRTTDPTARPPGCAPVEVLFFGYPLADAEELRGSAEDEAPGPERSVS